jgi:hypothetical protein
MHAKACIMGGALREGRDCQIEGCMRITGGYSMI